MAFVDVVYRTVFKRSSTFALFIIGSAFFVDTAIDRTADYIFDRINAGKLWKHIKPE